MNRLGILVGAVVLVVVGVVATISYQTYQLNENIKQVPPIDYLKNIPPKPDDYPLIKREMKSGYIDLSDLNESYWLQPDFYPNWDRAKQFYEQHDYSRWGVYGHGAYPANPEVVFNTTELGSWISFVVLYRTGYGIETYQGIKLVPEDNEYFDVEITPNQFLLKPTFPVFAKDWVKRLTINVTIKKEPPKGDYTININAVRPDKEQAKKWFWQVLRRESTPEEQEMITRAKYQAEKEGKLPEEFERWIEVGRKNKYVDASTFDVGPRITLKIRVV